MNARKETLSSPLHLDTSDDRVESPLRVPLKRIGTLRPRSANEVPGSNWRLGCEVLDRDYIDFREYRDFVAPLGIKTVRLQGGWAKCEKERGKYDFGWLDEIVDFLNVRGVACAIETSYGNPIYPGGGTRDLGGGFPTSEEGLAAWDAWVDALSLHFAGRVRDWLMWNEPDIIIGGEPKTPEMIAAIDVRTAKTILRNIPDARIAGLSLANCRIDFFEKCLAGMGSDVSLFSSFIYHGYMAAPETSYDAVEQMKTILAKYNPTAKLWQGENGCPSEMTSFFALNNIAWSEYSQAKWDMRRMLGDLGHDVISSVYTICDFLHAGADLNRGMNNKGLIRANEDRKAIAFKRAYYAVQNVAGLFDDTWTRVRGSTYGDGFGTTDRSLSTYHYRKATGEDLFVFWTHGRDGEWVRNPDGNGGRWIIPFERPGDSFETRPAIFRHTGGKPLADPVWIDLLTGRIYEFPINNRHTTATGITYTNVPVYDSPCVLTERRAVM